jgi:hypothetical protein
MTKLAAGSLLRTVFSSADAGALRIAVKGRLNLQLPPVAQWEAFWSVQDFRFWPKADIPSCTAHVRFRG